MKLDNKTLREYISRYVKRYLAEVEEEKPVDDAGGEEENPFAADKEGGEEEGGDAGGKEKGDEGEKAAKPATNAPEVTFDIDAVKKYNKGQFLSNKGVIKSIDKKGVVVTTQPDGTDVFVSFDDISESVKKFFKTKK
jgi:hypothetical protein